jgi:DNA-binding transcriptional MerR regulator
MEIDLISKKEVLELTGISYGQLYRWKRKNIIPESWFIKKSSYTGQETFFPREKMLARIDTIKEMKDGYSLDELSDFFSPNPTKIEIREEELRSHNILSAHTMAFCTSLIKMPPLFEFQDILNMVIIEKTQRLEIPKEAQQTLFLFLHEKYTPLKESSLELIGIRKGEAYIWMLLPLPSDFKVDHMSQVVLRFDLQQMMEDLKMTLTNMKGIHHP